ncbi:MAG: tellurite resistance TerB C-terminal domain-containing protein [Limisphaerales bacterium]
MFENRLAVLLSVHKEQGDIWQWERLAETPSPPRPDEIRRQQREVEAESPAMPPLIEPTRSNQREAEMLVESEQLPPVPAEPVIGDQHEQAIRAIMADTPTLTDPPCRGTRHEDEAKRRLTGLPPLPPVPTSARRHEQPVLAKESSLPPLPPAPNRKNAGAAKVQAKLEALSHGLMDMFFGKARKEKAALEQELAAAREADEAAFQQASKEYQDLVNQRAPFEAELKVARALDEAELQPAMLEYRRLADERLNLEHQVGAAHEADEQEHRQALAAYEQQAAVWEELQRQLCTARQADEWEYHQAKNEHALLLARHHEREARLAIARQADEADYQAERGAYEQALAHREQLLRIAKQGDEIKFSLLLRKFEPEFAEWQEQNTLARAVVAGERAAYVRVLQELTPAAELRELGSTIGFQIHSPKLLEVTVKVNGLQAIPNEVKSLTTSGKVSVKAMPKGRFHEIYQDYVCGCVLRIGREVFALLPVETVIVTATTDIFDSRTGCTAEQPILSVAMPRGVMKKLDFDRLDPSDAMENFLQRGDFKSSRKAGAFVPITPLTPTDLETTPSPDAAARTPPAGTAPSLPPMVNPFPAKWAEALRRNEIEFGFLRLTATELAELLGKPPQENFSLPESKALARAVESFGYCIEPDPRHGAGNFWGNREVGIFQPPTGMIQEPSESFLGASALLQLCLLVAAADGSVERGELDQFRQFIENQFQFTPDEHQRLIVLETLLARNAASAKVTLGRTAKRVPQDKHIVIAQFLVDVAAVDGVISPKEHKAMARIFEALGLSEDTLDTLIRNLPATGREVVIQSAEPAKPGEPIPVPGKRDFSAPLKLDMARVAAISAETHEVIGLLAKAMAEDETTAPEPRLFGQSETGTMPVVEAARMPQVGDTAPQRTGIAPAETVGAATTSTFDSLDLKYRAVVVRLVVRDTWSRAEFEALAWEHQLMPLSVFDAINEWADQQLGDFLLEGEATIIIHRNLLTS